MMQRQARPRAERRHQAIVTASPGAPVQRRAEGVGDVPEGAVRGEAARGVQGSGGALPYRELIQAAFGRHDVGGIRAHVGGVAEEASRSIGARAYAMGEAVAFTRAPDLRTAAHEAAHVIQQRAGVSLTGGVGQAGDRYERHADAVAEAVVSGGDASALLDPLGTSRGAAASGAVQKLGWGWPFFGGAGNEGAKKETEGTQHQAASPAHEAPAKRGGADAKGEGPAPATDEPPMPRELGQEGVLRTWIAEFNKSLAKRASRGKNPKLDRLKALGWADDQGLSYELLAAAVAKKDAERQDGRAPTGGDPAVSGAAPAPVTTARILGMLASANGVLRKVIDVDYPGKCMQFSEKMLVELGVRRADGSSHDIEKRRAAPGPLTALYRNKDVKDLPATLPPGYQVCITSMPEWGFTEVGNHWFVTAGDGYYLDNTGGVFTGAGMTANLRDSAAQQWARRVLDPEPKGLRAAMGKRFVDENPQFAPYKGAGRTSVQQQEKLKQGDNPEYKASSAAETAGRAAIEQFVKGARRYHPRIWLVEATTKKAP